MEKTPTMPVALPVSARSKALRFISADNSCERMREEQSVVDCVISKVGTCVKPSASSVQHCMHGKAQGFAIRPVSGFCESL